MGKQFSIPQELRQKVKECIGHDCDTPETFRNGVSKLTELYQKVREQGIGTPPIVETPNKLKGKFKANKSMSVEHKTEDISELVRKEVEKATKGTQQTTQTQEHPHAEQLKNMSPGINFLHCKGACGTMPNPKGRTSKYKECTNCGANTVHPDAEACPFCGNSDKEQFDVDNGIEIEDE